MPCWKKMCSVYQFPDVSNSNPIKQICSDWHFLQHYAYSLWLLLPYVRNCSAVQSFVLGFCQESVSNISGSTSTLGFAQSCPLPPHSFCKCATKSLLSGRDPCCLECSLWGLMAWKPFKALVCLTSPSPVLDSVPHSPFLYLFPFENLSPKERSQRPAKIEWYNFLPNLYPLGLNRYPAGAQSLSHSPFLSLWSN